MNVRRFFLIGVLGLTAGCASTGSKAPGNGGMDKEVIRRTVRSHVKDISACYNEALEKKPDLQGKLVMQWDIGKKGKVADVRVVRSVDPLVDDCVALKIESWVFPIEPKGDQVGRVIFPFGLSSKAVTEESETAEPPAK